MEENTVQKLQMTRGYVDLGLKHTVVETVRFMKDIISKDNSYISKIVFEDEWGSPSIFIATAKSDGDEDSEEVPVPENFVLAVDFDEAKRQVQEISTRRKQWRLAVKGVGRVKKRSATQILGKYFTEDEGNRFLGFHTLFACKNRPKMDNEIKFECLITNLYGMARVYLCNSVKTVDSYRNVRHQSTQMDRFIRDALNRNMEFDYADRGRKRGWYNGYYSVPKVVYHNSRYIWKRSGDAGD